MAVHSKLWYLERFRLIQVLPPAQRERVARASEMIEVRRRQRIYLPGDRSDRIFLLKTGVVKIAAVGPDDRELILALLHPGDIFGELAMVDESPRDHLAEAHEDCVLCALGRDLLLDLTRECPELGYQITKLIGLRLKTLRTRVEELLFRSAHERLARTLLDLAEQHGVRDAAGIMIPLRLSQSELGRLVGLTRETVNGILQDFRQRGLVEFDRRTIRLLQPGALGTVR